MRSFAPDLARRRPGLCTSLPVAESQRRAARHRTLNEVTAGDPALHPEIAIACSHAGMMSWMLSLFHCSAATEATVPPGWPPDL